MAMVAQTPEEGAVRARDEVAFATVPSRLALVRVASALVAMVLACALAVVFLQRVDPALAVRATPYVLVTFPLFALLPVAVNIAMSVATAHQRPAHIRSCGAGLELRAGGSNAVCIPWSAIAAYRLRGRGPFAELEVAVAPPQAATIVDPAQGLPRRRVRPGYAVYSVDIGLMRPGRDAIRAELARRLGPSAS